MVDQYEYPVNWDLIGSYSPNLMDAKIPSKSQNGTIAPGGQSSSVESAVSYNFNGFTLLGDGAATYMGERNLLNQSNDITINYRSYWQYDLEINTNTTLTDIIDMNAGATEFFNTHSGASYDSAGTTVHYTSNPGDDTELHAGLQFKVIPEECWASLTYTHDIYADSSTKYAASPTNNATSRNGNGNTFGFNVKFLLN
jgi:hypothetical protein